MVPNSKFCFLLWFHFKSPRRCAFLISLLQAVCHPIPNTWVIRWSRVSNEESDFLVSFSTSWHKSVLSFHTPGHLCLFPSAVKCAVWEKRISEAKTKSLWRLWINRGAAARELNTDCLHLWRVTVEKANMKWLGRYNLESKGEKTWR